MKIRVNPWPNFFGALGAGLLVIIFSLILLWHDPLVFWNDDYELSILPVFTDVARSWNEGHLPLLSPYSWVCSNLAGEFQYGTFSVFINAAVVLIWKFPLKFSEQAAALSIVHLAVLAAGGFMLGRGRRLSPALAILVAVVGALNGWIICWGATDWFGALGAFAWFPWCWWALEKSLGIAGRGDVEGRVPTRPALAETASQELRPPFSRSWGLAIVWPAPFVYLLITGGFPYTVVMLAVLVAWLGLRELVRAKSIRGLFPMLAGVALGVGLSAPAWLGLFDYIHGSNRGAQSGIAHWQWLVPPAALPGFLLPSWTVNWADFSTRYLPHGAGELACGFVPAAAVIGAFFVAGKKVVRRTGWELGLLILLVIVSMLPSAGVFRWSFRWLPFIHLALALCAAETLRLVREEGRATRLALVAFALFLAAYLSAVIFKTGGLDLVPTALTLGALLLAWIATELAAVPRLREWAPALGAFAVLLCTYLVTPPNSGVPKYNLSEDLRKPAPLDPSRLYLSIYPAAETLYRTENKPGPVGQIVRPGSTSMFAGLRFINGYSPILASGVAKQFGFAIHGEFDWAMQQWLLETAEGDLTLHELGVSGIVVAAESGLTPQAANEWDLVFQSDEGKVYHLHDWSPVEKIETRCSVTCFFPRSDKGSLLLFSRPFFPGYQAKLNGRSIPVGNWRGLVPSVKVPPGAGGRLVLTYRPWWLLWGGATSLVSALVLIGCGVTACWGQRRMDAVKVIWPTG